MTTVNSSTPKSQLQYDVKNATNDVKEMSYLKQQAANAPDHKLTAAQGQQLMKALQNFKVNEGAVTNDLHSLGQAGDTSGLAHAADYMNQLNNIAQQTSMGLEGGNDLDDSLTAGGSSAGQMHQALSDISTANSGNLDYANQVAPNSDMNYQAAVDAANDHSAAPTDGSEPYAAGHTAVPAGVTDAYKAPEAQ